MDFNETVPILMNLIIKTESYAFAIVNGKRSLHYFREFNRLLVCYDIKKNNTYYCFHVLHCEHPLC